MMRRWSAILAMSAVACLSGCASTEPRQTSSDAEWVREVFAQSQDPQRLMQTYRLTSGDRLELQLRLEPLAPTATSPTESFVLRPGHRVTVRFVQVSGLDVTQAIRSDGKISLPYLGDTAAAGLTVSELTQRLMVSYREHLKSPELFVVVDEPAGDNPEGDELDGLLRSEAVSTKVRPDGYASFPLMEDVLVAGLSVPELGGALKEAYRQVHPRILAELSLAEPAAVFVYVVGHVERPGAYPITRPVTVLEALSLAGSASRGAELQGVVVLRKRGDAVAARRLNVAGVGDERLAAFYLGPDDMVYVPQSSLNRTSELVRDLAEALMFRGWNVSLRWDDLDDQ